MMNRDKVEGAVFSINMRNELRNLLFEFRGVVQSGRRDLDEDDVADPLRIKLQELLKRPELKTQCKRTEVF